MSLFRLFFALGIALTLVLPSVAAPVSNTSSRLQDVVLVVDNSASMRKNNLGNSTKTAMTQFIRDCNEEMRIALLVFDKTVRMAVPLATASARNRDFLISKISQVNFQGAFTNIPEALLKAISELKLNGQANAAKSILLVTDGVIDTGDKARDLESTNVLQKYLASDAAFNNIKIYTVALGENADRLLLQVLAGLTDGVYYWVSKADYLPLTLKEIRQTIQKRAGMVAASKSTIKAEEVADVSPAAPSRSAPPQSKEATQEVAKSPQAPGSVAMSGNAQTEKPVSTSAERDAGPIKVVSIQSAEEPSANAPVPAAHDSVTYWAIGGITASAALMLFMIFMLARARAVQVQSVGQQNPKGRSDQPAPLEPQAFLHDLSGATNSTTHLLTAQVTIIGRVAPHQDDNIDSIVIDQPTISRHHAVIERKHFGYWLVDQQSRNGTFVNGHRITGPICLTHGDRVRFHTFEFEFQLAGMGLVDKTILVDNTALLSSSVERRCGVDRRSGKTRFLELPLDRRCGVDRRSGSDPASTGTLG
jgi:Mg-chelatase subunit ChlD